MASLAELMVSVGADIGDFSSKMKKVDQKLQDTGSKMKQTGKKMTEAGKTLGASVTAPLVALGATSVVTSAKFEEQMSKVSAVSGATGSEFDKLKSQARELGRTTQFSAMEASQGMEFLSRAGWETQDIISGLPSVLDLAKASAIDLGTASDIASNVMSGFGAEASETQRYIDVMAKSTSDFNTNMNQMGNAMSYVAPVANNLGLSVEETASAIGVMSNAGIQGSKAGTALRAGLSRLTNPTGQAKEAMNELGLSVYNAEGEFKSLPAIMQEIESSTAGMKDEARNQALAMLFGQEASAGWIELLKSGSGTMKGFKTDLQNAEGSASQMANTMGDNLAGKFKTLKSRIQDLMITMGERLSPVVSRITEFATKLTDKFNGLSKRTQGIITIVTVLVASLAPLLMMGGLLVTSFGALASAISAVSAPILAVIAGVVALGVAFVALWNKSKTFRETVKSVFNAIKAKVLTAVNIVKQFLFEKLQQIKKFWDKNGTQILQAVENAFNGIKSVIEFVMPVVQGIIKYVWNAIKNVIDGGLNVIMGLIKTFTGLFTGDFSKMWEGIKQMFAGAIEFVWGLMNLSFVGAIRKMVFKFAKNIWKKMKGMWGNIKGFFKSGKDKAVSLVTKLKDGVVKFFSNIRDRAKSIFSKVKSFVVNPVKSAKDRGVSIFQTLRDKATNLFGRLRDKAKSIFNKVKDFITNPIKSAKDTVKNMIEKIKGFFDGLSLKIPKPKLPKVSVTKKKGVLGIPYPDFDVSWNAKGGIFNGASLLGGGQGVGEAGAEAVLPVQHKRYMKPFANAIATQLDSGKSEGDMPNKVESHVTTVIELDGKEVARQTEPHVSNLLGNRQSRTNRSRGR